jgi:septal ring-binding cell division protein DamX
MLQLKSLFGILAHLTALLGLLGGASFTYAKDTGKHVAVKYKVESFTDADLKKKPHTIQIAAYLNEKDAIEHVEELRRTEKDAFYYPTKVRGQLWYKVCVGRFEKTEDAVKRQQAIIKKFDEPFAIVISLDRALTTEDKMTIVKNDLEDAPKVMDKEVQAPVRNVASEDKKVVEPKVDTAPKTEVATKTEKLTLPVATAPAFVPKKRTEPGKTESFPIKRDEPPVRVFEASKKVAGAVVSKEDDKVKNDTAPKAKAQSQVKLMPKSELKRYALQVSAHSTKEDAEKAAKKISGVDNVRVEAGDVNGKTWYRVLIGEFNTAKEARAYIELLKTKNGLDGFVRNVQ